MTTLLLRLGRTADAPRRARRALDEIAAAHLPEERLAEARLLLSELVTNSVRYAADGDVEVELVVEEQTLTARVRDEGEGVPEGREPGGMPVPEAGQGRGLALVAAIASRWGVVREGRPEVWFTLAG